MTEIIHEAGFERDHTRGQTLFPRHQQVGLGQSEATPAETGTAVDTDATHEVSASSVVEPRTPVRKTESPALNKGRTQPERRRAGEVHTSNKLCTLLSTPGSFTSGFFNAVVRFQLLVDECFASDDA